MTIDRCPGMDHKAYSDKSVFELPCPHCGKIIEMWSDDLQRKCPHCGATVPNPQAKTEPPAEE